jgi:hypothetical protein
LLGLTGASPRLVVIDTSETHLDHATLSHYWGAPGTWSIKLENGNYDSFMEAVPAEALKETSKDAICITQYLDSKDWRVQSALMITVY